jgi:uncharacterized protein YjeT (DUF2065 family)
MVMKPRNPPASILVVAVLMAFGAVFNFTLGLVFSLAPQLLKAIKVTKTASGAPPQLLIFTGIACIAFGFVFLWVFKELFNKAQFAIIMIYTISTINIIFGIFRLPFGLIFVAGNLLTLFLIRSASARKWLSSSA